LYSLAPPTTAVRFSLLHTFPIMMPQEVVDGLRVRQPLSLAKTLSARDQRMVRVLRRIDSFSSGSQRLPYYNEPGNGTTFTIRLPLAVEMETA
jgi:hypothetical protein